MLPGTNFGGKLRAQFYEGERFSNFLATKNNKEQTASDSNQDTANEN